jgi:hypothetical protein
VNGSVSWKAAQSREAIARGIGGAQLSPRIARRSARCFVPAVIFATSICPSPPLVAASAANLQRYSRDSCRSTITGPHQTFDPNRGTLPAKCGRSGVVARPRDDGPTATLCRRRRIDVGSVQSGRRIAEMIIRAFPIHSPFCTCRSPHRGRQGWRAFRYARKTARVSGVSGVGFSRQ